MRCYLALECRGCENTIHQLIFLLGEHRGLPVVPVDVGEGEQLECDACGTMNHTGELEVHADYGPGADDDE